MYPDSYHTVAFEKGASVKVWVLNHSPQMLWEEWGPRENPPDVGRTAPESSGARNIQTQDIVVVRRNHRSTVEECRHTILDLLWLN